MFKISSLCFLVFSTTVVIAKVGTLEKFDSSWSDRWWMSIAGGYTPSVARKDMADGRGGYLDIKAKGPGYGIIQSKPSLFSRMSSLKETPIGLAFRVSGGKKGTFLHFEVGGNRKTGIPLTGEPAWTTVNVPFANFSPAISFEELKKAGFVQFNLHGEMNFKLGAIGWMYPPKYDNTKLATLELANFQLKPNLEYNLFLKCGGQEKYGRIKFEKDTGWFETYDSPNKKVGGLNGFSFEVNGKFDEGGCPDWTQVRGITVLAQGNKKATLTISFFREGESAPLTTAQFSIPTQFTEVKIPVEDFDNDFVGGIGGCRIAMPDGVDIELKRVGVIVPEGMYKQEMKRRGERNVRYYHWRSSVFQAQGLEFALLDRAIGDFEKSVEEGDFGRYDEQKNQVDRLYWYGIELLALRAMNQANLDRAQAAKEQALAAMAKADGEKVGAIIAALKTSAELPSLGQMYEAENRLAERTMALVREKNLRPFVKGRQYYSPSGKPINYFGPHSFMASRKSMLMRQDIGYELMFKRLAAFGFSGIRFEAEENRLMPTEDQVAENTVKEYREAIEAAGKYGLWVQYDNHFYFPGWVCQGSREFPNPKGAGSSNSYQNLDAVLKVWKTTADVMKDMKNIFVFETPSNEPMFYDPTRSILDLPSMMHEWNQFLKQKYGTRANLNDAWTRNVECPKENKLQDGEDWDKDSIQPAGFSEKSLPDMKNQSARVWDWIEFAKHVQGKTTGAIAKTVRGVIPSATFMQQFIIANEWDHCPIPMNYQAIAQVQAEPSIFLGSHYGVSGRQVLKAVALGTPSTDSENPGEDNYSCYLTQKLLNSGATVFADYARWGGGMLWENDSCDYKESTAYIPLIADFFVNAEPLYKDPVPRVIVIEPTRLSATQQNDSVNDILAILDKANVACHLFEEHYVIDHPDVLAKYDCAIVNLTYANTQLLDVLKSRPVKVFLFGSPYKDAYTRVYPEGILGWFVKNGLLLASCKPSAGKDQPGEATTVSLEGNVKFKYDAKKTAQKEKWYSFEFDDSAWGVKPVPAYWGELGIMGSRKYFLGDGWYRFHVRIPREWKDKEITLKMGAIDDTDELYVNGRFVARTTTATPNWWQAPRSYIVPSTALRFGEDNVLAVKVTNTLDDAGIYRSPVSLSLRDTLQCRVDSDFGFLRRGELLTMILSRDHYYPLRSDLAASAKMLVGSGERSAIVKDRNFVLCSLFLQISQSPVHEKMLLSFLKDAGLEVDWPAKAEARVYPFTRNYFVVKGASEKDTVVRLKGNNYRHIGVEVLVNPRPDGGFIEFTVPKSSLSLIRVW